jgi:hypothetical protein
MVKHLHVIVSVMSSVAVLSAVGARQAVKASDVLTLTVRTSAGRVTAVNPWRRQAK